MYIYIATNAVNGKQYVGKSVNNPFKRRIPQHKQARGDNPAFHNAIQKYGFDNFTWEVIHYSHASQEALNAIECWYIAKLNTFRPIGYNLTKGGDGVDPESVRQWNIQRVVDGTNPFLGDNHWAKTPEGREHCRQRALNRAANGTHPFQLQVGENHPAHKRIKDGTHPFVGDSNPNSKRIADGSHHFLGDSNPIHKITKEGKHPSSKRIADGSHHFLGDSNPSRNPKVKLKKWKNRQAKKGQQTIDFD